MIFTLITNNKVLSDAMDTAKEIVALVKYSPKKEEMDVCEKGKLGSTQYNTMDSTGTVF